MRLLHRTSVILLGTVCMLCGCAIKERVLIGLDQYRSNPEAYQKYEVILSADLADILDRYNEYLDKRIQVTAHHEYFGYHGFWTWYIMLREGDRKLRCYTHHYRIRAEWDAENLLLWARSEGQPITINGILYRNGIDISEIIYKDQVVRPSVKTVRFYPWIWLYP